MSDLLVGVIIALAIVGGVVVLAWAGPRWRTAGWAGIAVGLAVLVQRLLRRDKPIQPPSSPRLKPPPRPVETEVLDRLAEETDEELVELQEQIDEVDHEFERDDRGARDVAGDSAAAERLRELLEE